MKKWILLSVLIIFLALCAGAFYLLSLPPKESLTKDFKEQAVSKLLGRKAQLDVVAEKTGNTTYNGKYITFDYPAKAVIYTYKDPSFASSSSLLEDFSFDIKEPRLVLNLAVLQNNTHMSSIDDNPGVMFRKNNPGQYKEVLQTVDGVSGRIYERNDETPEKTAFFLVKNRVYSISVTGTIFDEVKGLSDAILKTVKFK